MSNNADSMAYLDCFATNANSCHAVVLQEVEETVVLGLLATV